MGFCTSRNLLLTICTLQIIALCERQVFDFLGFLWIPILLNFFEIIFVIFGFFGAYQYRPKYIFSYLIWHLLWLAWNIFIICLYLDIGILNHKESTVLKIDQWSESWWVKNGPGCKVELNVTHPHRASENVVNCYLDYQYIEIFQAGLQTALALFGLITGFCLSRSFVEEDDSSSRKSRKNQKRMSLYSIEFSPQNGGDADSDSNEYDVEAHPQAVSPKPMTPRRVKRRSVMQRGTASRHSTTSRRHHNNNNNTHARSSTRSSRRSIQNPVTRLMEQQQKLQHQHHHHHHHQPYELPMPASSMDVNYHDYQMGMGAASTNNLMAPPLPPVWQPKGHSNPTYQQSSSQSLNEHDDFDDLYNNSRPPSARSSYSNFHGTRAINYGQPSSAGAYHGHATPQVPQKTLPAGGTHRQSLRSKAFLNNGPPAYTPHGHAHHVPLDSETAM